MNIVDVSGTNSNAILQYVQRVAAYLQLDQYDTIFELDISQTLSGNAHGYCTGDDELVTIDIARYDNEGRIDRNGMMRAIAHEMIHAQQLATGMMTNIGLVLYPKNGIQNIVQWDNVDYNTMEVPYEQQPWELDAYAREMAVYSSCS